MPVGTRKEKLNVTKSESEIIANLAGADFDGKRSDKAKIEIEQERLYLSRKKREQDLEESVDFYHGYIRFAEDVSEGSVAMFTTTLRRFERLFPGHPLTIEMMTRGGEIVSGLAMYDEIRRVSDQGHHITTRARGHCCSMGCVLMQAGDTREMGPSSFLMFHRGGFGAFGKTFDVEDELELMRMFEKRLVDIMVERSGNSPSYFTNLFKKRKDIWYNPELAIKRNLVDAIV